MLPKSKASISIGDGTEIVDLAGIDTRIFTLPREISLTYSSWVWSQNVYSEKSAEVIVLIWKRAVKDKQRSHKRGKD